MANASRLDYLGDYLRVTVLGTGNVVGKIINVAALLGIAVIAAVAYFAELDLASVAVSFVAFLVLVTVTHNASFTAYQEERRERARIETQLEEIRHRGPKLTVLLPESRTMDVLGHARFDISVSNAPGSDTSELTRVFVQGVHAH